MAEQFFRPTSLEEALALKAEWGPDLRPSAGCTDLLVKIRAGIMAPRAFLDLSHIEGLRSIRREESWLRLGATATARDCLQDPWIHERFPALWRACQWLGGPQMQHQATLGGNLGNASPAADTVPAIMAAGGEVVLRSESAERVLPLHEFLTGPGRTVIAADELIVEIRVPMSAFKPADPRPLIAEPGDELKLNTIPRHGPLPPANGSGPAEYATNMFYKAGARLAQVISVACVAGWARMRGTEVVELRLAFGSAAPTTRRAFAAEAFLAGKILTPGVIEAAVELLDRDISPITDIRGSADYKRLLCRNQTRLFLQDLAQCELSAGTPPSPPKPAPTGVL
ncbi:MAG: FAD binding domain-containing protein [Sumerlaeia bacterium]